MKTLSKESKRKARWQTNTTDSKDSESAINFPKPTRKLAAWAPGTRNTTCLLTQSSFLLCFEKKMAAEEAAMSVEEVSSPKRKHASEENGAASKKKRPLGYSLAEKMW